MFNSNFFQKLMFHPNIKYKTLFILLLTLILLNCNNNQTEKIENTADSTEITNLALDLKSQGLFNESVEKLNESLQVNPNQPKALQARGESLLLLGKPQEALNDFNKTIEISTSLDNQKKLELYKLRAQAYIYLGENRKAIEDFTEAIKLDSNNANLYSKRGKSYLEVIELRLSLKDYDQAIKIDPSKAEYYAGRGDVFTKKGDYRMAIEDYGMALQLDPKQSADV